MKKKTISQETMLPIKNRLEQIEYIFNTALNKNSKLLNRQPEIAFAISLKSKTVSRDWDKVQDNLSKTIRSILNNSDPHFRIVIAGHEKPDIEEFKHEGVTWLSVTFPPPTDPGHYTIDKMHKRRVIGAYLRNSGYSGYFMQLDADDWIHYRFVEFIRSQPISAAFIIDNGFMVNVATKEVWHRKRFNRGCGSSALYYLTNRDFPNTTSKEEAFKTLFGMSIQAHSRLESRMQMENKNYMFVTFPLVVYVLGHGDNISVLKGKKRRGISARAYRVNGEKLEDWFYEYFRVGK